MRGKTHVEERKWNTYLVIDEIPYLLNKSNLVAKIGDLVVNKKIDGVTDITDESSKDLIRVVITLKKWIDPDNILVQLYKQTELQSNFNMNNVTLVEKGIQPRMLNIKDLLMQFVNFRREVVLRRSIYQFDKAKARLHILEGLKIALDILDAVIALIRASHTKEDAKSSLMSEFWFTEIQSEYILQMRLQSLVGLEIEKILNEIEEKLKLIEYLDWIIWDPIKRDELVMDEMRDVKKSYGDARRTEVYDDASVYELGKSLKAIKDAADRVKEDVILWVWNDSHIKVLYQSRILAIPEETYELIYTHNQDRLIVITDQAELVVIRLKDFGQFKMVNKALDLQSQFELKGTVIFARTLSQADYKHLCFLTNKNSLKKIDKKLLLQFKKFPTICMWLAKNEHIVAVLPVTKGDKIVVLSQQWIWLIFDEKEVRSMGKTAWWVKAIDLQDGDEIANMFVYRDEPFVMIYSKKDAKMLMLEELRVWKRARRGDLWVSLKKWQVLQGGMSVVEWNVRLRLSDGSVETHDCNDICLASPEKWLEKLTEKSIEIAYRPWEERDEDMKYKDDKNRPVEDEGLFGEEESWNDITLVWDGEDLWGDV